MVVYGNFFMEPTQQETVQITIQTWQAIAGLITFVFVIGAAWGTLWTLIKGLQDGLKTLTGRFDSWLHAAATGNAAPEGRTASPMVPSELGSTLLLDSGVRSVISEKSFKDWFFALVDKHSPKSGYEVEQKVFAVLVETQNDPRWNAVKEYVFNHPIVNDRPLTMERLLVIASWVLRAEYMVSRKINP